MGVLITRRSWQTGVDGFEHLAWNVCVVRDHRVRVPAVEAKDGPAVARPWISLDADGRV